MGDTKLAKVGITVKEPWAVGISYEVLDYVLWRVQDGGDGCGYIAKRDNIGVQPGLDDETWVKATQAGQSIYDLAVKYGHFEGTEEEFEAQYQAALAAANAAATAASETNAQIQNAETLRVAAESNRVSAETARVDAESRRVSAEQTRDNNETARAAAEAVRASSETGRVSAENGRVSAESSRVSAESARVSAENERRADFESLETDMRTAIGQADAATRTAVALNEQVQVAENARVSAEQSRVSAESARASAETARASAETARETQAGNDHTRAESDHSTAASDHTTAGQDHTQAGTDHTRAESDHTQAGADHTQAVADHTASEAATTAANTAAAAADAAREGIQDELDQKANKDGYYGGMTVGSAENLVGRGTVEAEYAGVRTSAGTADIGSGSAAIARMKGQSFVWNQMINDMNSSADWASYNTSGVLNSDGSVTVTNTGNGCWWPKSGSQDTRYILVVGHKYLVRATIKRDSGDETFRIHVGQLSVNGGGRLAYVLGVDPTPSYETYSLITPAFAVSPSYAAFGVGFNGVGTGNVITVKNYMLIDLTLLFGAGNEPSTVEEFDAWRKEMGLTLDYYDYNPGEVINNKAAGILTRGFNLYNPSTGKAFLPGPYSDYPHEYEICGTFSSVSFTDINGNTSVPTLTDGKFFNVDAPGELTVVGGNNTDTLVHLVWSGWRNEGEPDYAFEPYWENTLNLNLTQLTGKLNGAGNSVVVFPNGLAKIGDVQDEIVGNKAIKRIGVVDMGTLNWTRTSSSGAYFLNAPVSDMAQPSTQAERIEGLVCSKYPADSIIYINSTCTDKTIRRNEQRIFVRDDSYTDATTFDTAVTGTLLFYELATPEEYILDTTPDWNYRVDDFGTEQVLPSYDASNLTAPISYDVQYAMNAVDAIRRLPDTYVERTDVKQVAGRSEEYILSQKGVDDNYAKKVGVENDLVVGAAKALAGNQRQDKEFSTMVMDGADGIAKINEAMGKSIVWNNYGGIYDADKIKYDTYGCTVNVTQDELICTNSSQYTSSIFVIGPQPPLLNDRGNHKFYCAIAYRRISSDGNLSISLSNTQSQSLATDYIRVESSSGSYYYRRFICTRNNTNPLNRVGVYITLTNQTTGEDSFAVKKDSLKIIDLTQMFGAGNEPATVEEFEKLFPLPYYEYNAGEIISNKTQSLGITGFNQWDEEWESGFLNDQGQKAADSTSTRTKNYIPILGGNSYYVSIPTSGIRICWYDENKTFISKLSGGIYNMDVVAPQNASYMMFYTQTSYGTTYKNDICINLSDPNRNGTYEPYKHADLPLNLSTITGKLNGEGESVVIFPDGLRSAGTVYDSLLVDEDGYARKAVKRMGSVDLGTLNWGAPTYSNAHWRTSNGSLEGIVKAPSSGTANPNAITTTLRTATPDQLYLHTFEDSFTFNTSGQLNVYRSKYATGEYTAAQIKSDLSGVELIYELATYETYDLDEPIPMTFMAYHGGTITQTPQAPDSAPMRMNMTFALDAVSTINGLPQNYVSKESLQAMLAAMQSAGIFASYTMVWDATNSRWTFTFTANS